MHCSLFKVLKFIFWFPQMQEVWFTKVWSEIKWAFVHFHLIRCKQIKKEISSSHFSSLDLETLLFIPCVGGNSVNKKMIWHLLDKLDFFKIILLTFSSKIFVKRALGLVYFCISVFFWISNFCYFFEQVKLHVMTAHPKCLLVRWSKSSVHRPLQDMGMSFSLWSVVEEGRETPDVLLKKKNLQCTIHISSS